MKRDDQTRRAPAHIATINGAIEVKLTEGNDIKLLSGFTGEIKGDIQTGAFTIENEGGTLIYLPSRKNVTGKRKRRLDLLYNL